MDFLSQVFEILKTIETKGDNTMKMARVLSMLSHHIHQETDKPSVSPSEVNNDQYMQNR